MKIDIEKLNEVVIELLDRVDDKYRRSIIASVVLTISILRTNCSNGDKEQLKKSADIILITIASLLNEEIEKFNYDIIKIIENLEMIMKKSIAKEK
jgi:hypothetical protein